jgi:lipid-A-disaccharide synthase-like uncharacterized protein
MPRLLVHLPFHLFRNADALLHILRDWYTPQWKPLGLISAFTCALRFAVYWLALRSLPILLWYAYLYDENTFAASIARQQMIAS